MNIFGIKIPINYSRTMLAAHLAILAGVLGAFGIDFPAQTLVDLYGSIIDALVLVTGDLEAAYALLSGVVLAVFRMITDSGLSGGLKGLLGVKDA